MIKSPLSELPPTKVRDLPRTFLVEELQKYYGATAPADAVECDYELWRCAETGLEFASPMRPGSIGFYKWISGFSSYYPGVRWEYGEVRRLLGADAPKIEVLDVGCGKGDFLQGLDSVPVGSRHGVDLNEPAIAACKALGFKACCGTIESALGGGFMRERQFGAVTSFHCLEHVEEPVEFVRSMLRLVAPGGKLFVSTPYSPMSFESEWFDVMNHPPHHMTRWNLRAYEKLAQLVGAKMRWFAPKSNATKRAIAEFRLHKYGPHRSVGKATLLKDLALNFGMFQRFAKRQQERERTTGGIAADVILVELSPQ